MLNPTGGIQGKGRSLVCLIMAGLFVANLPNCFANGNVYVSRFWHNHQPIYWPEWNNNGNQISRVQYAWDSIVLKPGQNYQGLSPKQHPENNLNEIFGINDRVNSYQSGPRNSLAAFNSSGGFAISYSGSLIDNVRQLGSVGQLGYGNGWNSGYKEARGWKTPAGSTRMDLVGFTYHHSLAPLLPKSVFRKELQTFKQAWWKAWGGKSDLSDHSRGFFPTEMGYSRHLIDVLAEEGYQWVIVASHHISRTSPSYNTKANPEGSYNIFSSPPNKADQLGPISTNGWWYSEPNPGNAAWNLAPFAYQLHKVKYVNPETGAEKTMIAVPSDDVLSYRFGYANEGIGQIGASISPLATDPNRPVIVMPSTDGDNAWGGGSSSWFEATPQFFNNSASTGYKPSTPQDFVNAHGAAAPVTHIEDGAWIFPEMCYGSPNFMKWIEPPVATVAKRGVTTVPGTQIDMETPGFALKFYSYAPLMAGANWCETAEQILRDEGGTVQAWKVASPYDWDGTWTSPNEVEQAWHIYLVGLDSGFNYYGGLGNDDEIKPGLATRRAVEKLTPWMTETRRNNDRTGPTVLKPQRFPYNPGWYTFGWFNQQPQIPNNAFLKRMNSDFYIWTHAYDLNSISNIVVKVRFDLDGTNSLASNQNETYGGGPEVGTWASLAMTKRELPKTREALNAAAANNQIDYFLPVQTNAVADYYFAKINDTNLPGFRSKLLDYYIEATDMKGNVSKSEIQHVWVDDYSGQVNGGGGGGGGGASNSVVTLDPVVPVSGQTLTVTYNPTGRVLASAGSVNLHHGFNQNTPANWTILPGVAMTKSGSNWVVTYNVASNATTIAMCFNNGSGAWDNNGGGNWNFNVTNAPPTQPPGAPTGLIVQGVATNSVSLRWTNTPTASSYLVYRNGLSHATTPDPNFVDLSCQPDTEYLYAVAAVNAAGTSSNSVPVTARTLFLPVGRFDLRLVSPGQTVFTSNGLVLFSGHAGAGLSNGITWSNTANGQTGSVIPNGDTNASGWAWTANLPLVNGSNRFTFSSGYPTTNAPRQTGNDSPTNYLSWSSGDSNGIGFGAWTISAGSGSAGSFLANISDSLTLGADVATNYGTNWTNGAGGGTGFASWATESAGSGALLFGNPATAGIGGMGIKAFQLRAPAGSSNTFAAAERRLSQALSPGQTLSFLWGINWDCQTTNGSKGFVLSAGNTEMVAVNNGNSPVITVNGVDTGFSYGTQAMRWSFRLLPANILEVSATDRAGAGTFRTNLAVAAPPDKVRFYAANMEADPRREPYFDDFRVEAPVYGNYSFANPPKAFGLWSSTTNQEVSARRSLPSPMQVGDSLTVQLDNNWVETAGEVGMALRTDSGTQRLRFYFVGGDFAYQLDDAGTTGPRNTQAGYTSGGFSATFKLTGVNSYSLRLGEAATPITGTLAATGSISQLEFFNRGAGPGTERNFYVGNMTFTEERTTQAWATLSAPPVILSTAISAIPAAWWDAFGIPAESRFDLADRDGDGWTNAQEFAFGLDPTSAGGKTAEVDPDNPSKILFVRRNAGANYAVQYAADLATGFGSTVPANSSTNQVGVPTGFTRYEATFPAGARGFLRVEAVLTP